MLKKHHLAAILLIVLLCSCLASVLAFAASRPDQPLEPQYEHTSRISASLSISKNGTASCIGTIKAISNTSKVNITLRLLRKNGSSWTPVKTWTKDNQPSSASIDKDCSVGAGTYKLVISGSVTTDKGRTEFVSTSSSEKVYAGNSSGT